MTVTREVSAERGTVQYVIDSVDEDMIVEIQRVGYDGAEASTVGIMRSVADAINYLMRTVHDGCTLRVFEVHGGAHHYQYRYRHDDEYPSSETHPMRTIHLVLDGPAGSGYTSQEYWLYERVIGWTCI